MMYLYAFLAALPWVAGIFTIEKRVTQASRAIALKKLR